jgi:hypothetical protein
MPPPTSPLPSTRRPFLRALPYSGLLALLALATPSASQEVGEGGLPQLQDLRTPAETSGFARHTGHDEMMAYLPRVQAEASDMRLGSYGRTLEGRELPFALFSRPHVTSPAEAHATGKPVVVLGANAHGHNYVAREALLILLRELGAPDSEMNALLDRVIVLVVPSKNPDGLAAEDRFNTRGADLNRDYMTLDQPSMAAYVGNVINRWNPHLFVDGHDGGAVQYGGAFPYHLLYQGPGLAGADPTLGDLADHRVLPHVNTALVREGFQSFYWSRGDAERWLVGGAAPRMGRNYGGLSNKLSILFEVAEWPGMEVGVEVALHAYRSILTYARDHGDELVGTVQAARERTVALGREATGQVPVEERMEADSLRVTYQIVDPARVDPARVDPARPAREEALLTVEDAPILRQAVGTRFRDRPWAYLLPPSAEAAVALLKRHRIEVERLVTPVEVDVRGYTLEGIRWESADNHHGAAPVLQVGQEVEDRVLLPQGTWVVRTGQVLGRVVTHLLEPETTDNVFYWDRMTFLLPLAELEAFRTNPETVDPPLLPIRKLMAPARLPTVLDGG